MADTEISVYQGLDIYNSNKVYIFETLLDHSTERADFKNKMFSLEEDTLLSFNKQIASIMYNLESKYFSTITPAVPIVDTSKYNMRARKVSDNSFVYWSSSEIDYTGASSGVAINDLYDICVLNYIK